MTNTAFWRPKFFTPGETKWVPWLWLSCKLHYFLWYFGELAARGPPYLPLRLLINPPCRRRSVGNSDVLVQFIKLEAHKHKSQRLMIWGRGWFSKSIFPLGTPPVTFSDFYRPRSKGDNTFGSVRPSVRPSVCPFACMRSPAWTVWPLTLIFGMGVDLDLG